MSLFACPNAQRLLARAALRSASRAQQQQPFTPLRWLSIPSGSSKCSGVARFRRGGAFSEARCRNGAALTLPPNYTRENRRTFFTDKTIKNYEDLPKDYRDQAGLSFRSVDLTESEVASIFGLGINKKAANHLLRVLHGRRVAGTLEDPIFAVNTAQYTDDQIAKALEYLRRSVLVNEIVNAGLRAEDELEQMELEAAEKEKQKDNTAAAAAAAVTAKKADAEAADVYKPDPVYGRSKLDEIRARNVAKRKAEEVRMEEERKAAEARGEKVGTLMDAKSTTHQIANPKIQEYYDKAQSPLKEAPEMKNWERILPSATVVVLALGFLGAVAMVYEEPAPRFRLLREVTTAQATVGSMIAMNLLVFVAWRIPPLWAMLNRNMIMVIGKAKPVTLFTAIFSHQQAYHLMINMIPLWFVGTAVHEEIGRANFLALYLACGSVGFLASLITYTLRGWLAVSTLGASGATLGTLAAYLWEHRDDGFKFFGLPDNGVHGIVLLAMLFVPQLTAFGKMVKLKTDLASHLGGMLMGVLGIEYLNRGNEDKGRKVFEVFTEEKENAAAVVQHERELMQVREAARK